MSQPWTSRLLAAYRLVIGRFWIDPLETLLEEMIGLPRASFWVPVRRAAEFARDLGRLVYGGPRVSVRRWVGPDWTIVLVSQDDAIWDNELRHVLFGVSPAEHSGVRLWLWQVPALVRAEAAADRLVVLHLNRLLKWRFPDLWCVRVPPSLRAIMDISAPLEAVKAGMTRRRRQELTRLAGLGLGSAVSRDPAEFTRFYQDMHAPFVTERYRDRIRMRPLEAQKRVFERRGVLLWLTRGRHTVAGVFGVRRKFGRTFCAIHLGIDQSQDEAIRRHAITALYWRLITWSHDAGCRSIDFGLAPAQLADGLFLYKHRWGMRFDRDRTLHSVWTFAGRSLPSALVRRLNELGLVAEAVGGYRCAIFPGEDGTGLSASEQAQRVKIMAQARLDGFLPVGTAGAFVSPSR
ncbi:MAG TPA: GNAT family N-acetyltransferase [Vicinamibacterales bacterium]|nr:GNAT family N-acetyltransferase [Vicinamibacterales bacterium]HPW20710.1 GNAT family N-acetyltransferase [Vicinamibacterales bacterium]